MLKLVDFEKASFWYALASIFFNPTFWNVVARQEYHSKLLTKLAGGNPYRGCYGLALTIFSLGIFRDYLYSQALSEQPVHPLLQTDLVKLLAAGLFVCGNVLVLTSMYTLGVTGTYLGDYFGILMSQRVTGFPFNVSNNPMYHGSTMIFLASALWYGVPAGILLTAVVYITYNVALKFEEPFTAMIYSKRK
ncbi:phospholipid methyltransferase [Basidiobolus meristosporus CBS 931.73]|uniref:Phosphatidyl-N-methylethanolamine N-methyltransferase n=1 Tax=Basidiobolus meristosporus CBS 931.73 TaxID=1314790 RepID=A0A1Y1Z1L5_9FUNG|nr:phospholipid methyltransferase [Basidiobolus meristosporus CBS 931.73]|eukprot:ORY04099.1 phospholipid methyltransferase [Basidiobolus meristosporus CBS 931.73]